MGVNPSYRVHEKVPKYEKLYKLADINKKKLERMRQNSNKFIFQPQINKSQITASFKERQEYYNHRREEKQQMYYKNQ